MTLTASGQLKLPPSVELEVMEQKSIRRAIKCAREELNITVSALNTVVGKDALQDNLSSFEINCLNSEAARELISALVALCVQWHTTY